MAPGFGLLIVALVAIAAVAITLVAVLAKGLGHAWRRRGYPRDTRDIGLCGTLAGLATATTAALYWVMGGEAFSWFLFWFGGFLLPVAALVLSLGALIAWAVWARATRAGASRTNGEWMLAVWALLAGLAGPVAIGMVWALSKL